LARVTLSLLAGVDLLNYWGAGTRFQVQVLFSSCSRVLRTRIEPRDPCGVAKSFDMKCVHRSGERISIRRPREYQLRLRLSVWRRKDKSYRHGMGSLAHSVGP